jgi:hypothetical protein
LDGYFDHFLAELFIRINRYLVEFFQQSFQRFLLVVGCSQKLQNVLETVVVQIVPVSFELLYYFSLGKLELHAILMYSKF